MMHGAITCTGTVFISSLI